MKMARLLRSGVLALDGDTFPSEYEGIDGPSTRTEHGKTYREYGKQDVTFVPFRVGDRHEQLGHRFQATQNGGPKAKTNANSHTDKRGVDFQ